MRISIRVLGVCPTPAPHGTRPILAANQVPISVYGRIRGSITKNVPSPCPSERAPANYAGTPKPIGALCGFTSENKEEKTNCHLNSNCRTFFCGLYMRDFVEKATVFFDAYKHFAGADSEYWRGALKKSPWLAFGVYTFCTIPQTLQPGSKLMVVVYLAYAGVGR